MDGARTGTSTRRWQTRQRRQGIGSPPVRHGSEQRSATTSQNSSGSSTWNGTTVRLCRRLPRDGEPFNSSIPRLNGSSASSTAKLWWAICTAAVREARRAAQIAHQSFAVELALEPFSRGIEELKGSPSRGNRLHSRTVVPFHVEDPDEF